MSNYHGMFDRGLRFYCLPHKFGSMACKCDEHYTLTIPPYSDENLKALYKCCPNCGEKIELKR